MELVENDHVIEAVAAEGADHALDERILPGALRSDEDFFDAHVFHATPERVAVYPITIADQVARRVVEREAVGCECQASDFSNWHTVACCGTSFEAAVKSDK